MSERKAFGRIKDGARSTATCVHNGAPASPGNTTMVGEVVFGWGARQPSPRADVDTTALFRGAAGTRTGRVEERAKSKMRCNMGIATTVDELIHGRDGAAPDAGSPHRKFAAKFDEHAGLRSAERIRQMDKERRKKPGCILSKCAIVDQVVFGRDLDGSGEDPHEAYMNQFGDHAGMRSREEKNRHAKPGLSMKSTVDTLLYGRDIDGSGPNTHEETMKVLNEGAAGIRSGDKVRGRKAGLQMVTCIEEVVYNKANQRDGSEDYISTFREYAGVRSSPRIMRTASCPAGQLAAPGGASQEATLLTEGQLEQLELSAGSQERREAWAAGPQAEAAAAGAPQEQQKAQTSSPSTEYSCPQRVNPFGASPGRRQSSTSSCSSTSRPRTARATDRRICFDECSASSRGSLRPRWR